jgi:ATP-dependent Zn protease
MFNYLFFQKERGKAVFLSFFLKSTLFVCLALAVCLQMNAQTIVVEDITGKTQTAPADQIQVYPNPSMGDVMVRPAKKAKITHLRVRNLYGNVLYDIPVNGRTLVPHNLSAGTYIFEVHTEQGLVHKHIIIAYS